jgi:ferredoxin
VPARYHIHTNPCPPRFPVVGKLGIVDWREDCLGCHNCVKRSCVYGFYRDEADRLRDEIGYLDYVYQCKGCLSCIQNCTKGILTRVVNPEYKSLGDDYYTPDIVLTTWYQAETGHVPVSGSGYGGPFSGTGFDSMWTDMSEIVRPTRDGIHGREYINTSVDIGRKPKHLAFQNMTLTTELPSLLETPAPLIFDVLPEHFYRGPMRVLITQAAAQMGLLSVVPRKEIPSPSQAYPNVSHGAVIGTPTENPLALARKNIIPLMEDPQNDDDESLADSRFVMVRDREDILAVCESLKERTPSRIVAIRTPATPATTERIMELTRGGAEVIFLVFDLHGMETAPLNPRHMRDVLRDVHGALTKDGIRDEVTLVASGGIALPEHMAKAIICGADLVAVDLALVLALECRLCWECKRGEKCPIELATIEPEFAVQRIVNLIGAWRNQLLEMLGAMGIREVRRLRGETGRCMFFEDLERETFGRLFGKRKAEVGTG